jgi:hypothetical protein
LIPEGSVPRNITLRVSIPSKAARLVKSDVLCFALISKGFE